MKKQMLLMGFILLLGGCVKELDRGSGDVWNGYYSYLKSGESVHTLWAGQNIEIGTVTYGINADACFYVIYDCSTSGWMISETHMYAGTKEDMPVNKPGSPKVGLFPYSEDHDPWVSVYTYYIPLCDLPPAEDPGFVVASHCVVHGPGQQQETAWAEGDHTFNDKGWGWYNTYYFNLSQDTSVIIYGTQYVSDTLMIYLINLTTNTAENIVVEIVDDVQGRYDASAYDETANLYFYANYYTGELWINPLGDDSGSFLAGMLIGTPASGTFFDQSYYYVDEEINTINKVDFNADWSVSAITVLSTIPGSIMVNDIAVSPSGETFYISGELDGASVMMSWNMEFDTYYSSAIALDPGAQIAYGSDGNLYALAGSDGGTNVNVYQVSVQNETFTPVNSGVIINEEPFSDITGGRSF